MEGSADCPICFEDMADGSRSVVHGSCGHDICLPCFFQMCLSSVAGSADTFLRLGARGTTCPVCHHGTDLLDTFESGQTEAPAPTAPTAAALAQQTRAAPQQLPEITIQLDGMPHRQYLCAVTAIWHALEGLAQRANLNTDDILRGLMAAHNRMVNPPDIRPGFGPDHISDYFHNISGFLLLFKSLHFLLFQQQVSRVEVHQN